ncbi:hypothetical protein [Leptolyngbya ohadii]|uniref:hypothetical protein n=1 Tax=Leptolyngbya ohadii TaxID=1962290 RepID=UPI0019D43CD9|nr:hypothetical protein [Leptolyngbya ohadii]
MNEYDVLTLVDDNGAIGEQTPLSAPAALPTPIPQPIPPFPQLRASGLYEWKREIHLPTTPIPQPIPHPIPQPTPTLSSPIVLALRQELRLDVDGRYPLMVASGTSFFRFTARVHWIANLTKTGLNSWSGNIWYKDGDTAQFLYTQVQISVQRGWFPVQQSATVTFSGGGAAEYSLTYEYKSSYYHPVEFEFDYEKGVTPVTEIDTHAHPNRPTTLPKETLSIETVYRRVGFEVAKSGGDSAIPGPPPGPEQKWSDNEMHDAMQVHWSRFSNAPRWAMWVFFATQHEMGSGLGGIMFDDIGSNHRQGTAIFYNSFISQAPSSDPAPDAQVKRMRFWTAVHEMGHAFNLAHSWQKALGTPWIPLANEPEARSFMNYPYNVNGGQTAFFSNFEYRFTNSELLFMRHAPFRFVQPGNANWFDHHGFQQASISQSPTFQLELRVNRKQALFEFMEPVVLELKLTNTSSQPQLISDKLLSELDHLMVIIKKDSKPARQFAPYAHYCWKSQVRVLMPGESTYESLFISAGKNGWDVAEPGYYTLQAALHVESTGEDVVSNPLRLRIAPPQGYDEEFLAQDFFSEEVGRILSFDGSRVLNGGNNTLREVSERLGDRKVAIHAQVALAMPLAKAYKVLEAGDAGQPRIRVLPPNPEAANRELSDALLEQPHAAAETLGHIDYKDYVDRFSDHLEQQGDIQEAMDAQETLLNTLSSRQVIDRVLQAIQQRRDTYQR